MIDAPLQPIPDDPTRLSSFVDANWLGECRVLELTGVPVEQRSFDGESFLLVLSGTHDLFAGGGSWLRRGRRVEPFAADKPVGVYLPPNTPFRLENGTGRAIVWAVQQPPVTAAPTPRGELARQPLLQMAGSGKAFDPVSGTWKPKEAFASSPEAILPRRIEHIELDDGARLARVLDADYKTRGLCIDELVLDESANATIPPLCNGHSPAEIGVYYEAEAELAFGDNVVRGAGVCWTKDGLPTLRSIGGRSYLALAYAGPKPTT